MSGARSLQWNVKAGAALRGRVRVPGDKSVSHRAIMFASLADGISEISGFLEGEDTLATAAAFRAMGVRIETSDSGLRRVHGVGLHGLHAAGVDIDCGNAGTAMRLLSGLLAGQSFDSVLCGDASLHKRPMRRVIEPLNAMGAMISSEPGGLPPLRISGAQPLKGIHYVLPVASAQVKSALLLAGLYAQGKTVVTEPHATRDYTESMLRAFGVTVDVDANTVALSAPAGLQATRVEVPADFSSAAFFLVAASIVPGSDLVLESVGMNPRRTGLLDTLLDMGANIEVLNRRQQGGEWVADLHVCAAQLRGVEVPVERVSDMIDEFPALFVAASVAQGETRIRGAAELRVKESDRIGVMAMGLRALGADIIETDDGAVIQGREALSGGIVASATDHRCAMSFAVAALRSTGTVTINACENVATSFPGFEEVAASIGILIQSVECDPT